MYEPNQIDTVLLEEPPIEQGASLPPQTPGQPSGFRKILTAVSARLRVLLAKFVPLVKSHPRIAWGGAGLGLVVAVALGAWYLHQSGTTVPTNPQAAKTTNRQRASHKLQPDRASNPQATNLEKLENQARDAYKKTHYVLPIDSSALAYSKRALALDPSNNYSRMMLRSSIDGGKDQVRQALKRKDFAQAHRLANAMAQLQPGREDVAKLKQDISIAEGGATGAHRQKAVPSQKAVRTVSFSAYHLHGKKAPADQGPYCLGVLSLNGDHLKFSGQSASKGEKVHKFDIACSDVREIKKNARIASRQGGFHIRTASATINFAPRDSSPAHISALASACSK